MQLSFALLLSAASMAAATITCVKPGSEQTASWSIEDGSTCEWTGKVGDNWGTTSGGSYDCMGACAGGCPAQFVPGSWTLECYTLAVCNYFFNTTNGGKHDPNCGDAYKKAQDGKWLGVGAGCGESTPSPAYRDNNPPEFAYLECTEGPPADEDEGN